MQAFKHLKFGIFCIELRLHRIRRKLFSLWLRGAFRVAYKIMNKGIFIMEEAFCSLKDFSTDEIACSVVILNCENVKGADLARFVRHPFVFIKKYSSYVSHMKSAKTAQCIY